MISETPLIDGDNRALVKSGSADVDLRMLHQDYGWG